MKICWYLLLHTKTICWRFRIKIAFTFWDMRTRDMGKGCLKIFINIQGLFLYEHKHIARFSNLHQCNFNDTERANIPKFPLEWRLWENVALRLMGCLTSSVNFDILMDNYFTSFRLLTNIRATRALNKNRLNKCTIIGSKQLP